MAKEGYVLRGGIVLIIALISWAVYVSSKELARNQRIEDEVALLEKEAEKIRRENETLSEKIGYFASPNFREQEAKEKLGLKKVHEEVVVIKPRGESALPEEAMLTEPRPVAEGTALPNYKKWWQLFFASAR